MHFTRDDLTRTSRAASSVVVPARRYGRKVPEEEIERNLASLQADILEPLAEALGRGTLSSCYRSPVVNALVGGDPNSAHMVGLAADWMPAVSISEAVQWMAGSSLPLDRVIYEIRGKAKWLHVQRHDPGQLPHEIVWLISPQAGVYQHCTPTDIARRAA